MIEVVTLAGEFSTDPKLVVLSQQIFNNLSSEASTLKVLRVQWKGEDPASEYEPPLHDDSNTGSWGDTTAISRLRSLSGGDFDAAWLQYMVALGRRAIAQAKIEVARGENVNTIAVAQQALTSRQAEIDQMTAMAAWNGGHS
ncbi:DUF305 domain-containing protein [[Mycobacterium] vasticus]|uniref:DUF305 domain-containing protein n=1 Tax=[Mycobacterium] vasticus TaxID=2875777 RepID=A0ABU5Z2N1_9MYCO|nr:DUF305 domain-containing protein [Mycolicibacter sp. MYC017]MEB3071662.1 DUF305 domain-containing protein [Mycolicibacter sp. MYC017]